MRTFRHSISLKPVAPSCTLTLHCQNSETIWTRIIRVDNATPQEVIDSFWNIVDEYEYAHYVVKSADLTDSRDGITLTRHLSKDYGNTELGWY